MKRFFIIIIIIIDTVPVKNIEKNKIPDKALKIDKSKALNKSDLINPNHLRFN